MEGHAPVYVKITDYEEVLSILESVKRKADEARALLQKLNDLKSDEDRELLAWTEGLDDITTRVEQIDRYLVNQ